MSHLSSAICLCPAPAPSITSNKSNSHQLLQSDIFRQNNLERVSSSPFWIIKFSVTTKRATITGCIFAYVALYIELIFSNNLYLLHNPDLIYLQTQIRWAVPPVFFYLNPKYCPWSSQEASCVLHVEIYYSES